MTTRQKRGNNYYEESEYDNGGYVDDEYEDNEYEDEYCNAEMSEGEDTEGGEYPEINPKVYTDSNKIETYIKNPETMKQIKIGGRVYKNLIKRGIINNNSKCRNTTQKTNQITNQETVSNTSTLQTQSQQGKGKYGGRLTNKVKEIKPEKVKEMKPGKVERTLNTIKRATKKNMDSTHDQEDLESQIEKMIWDELGMDN